MSAQILELIDKNLKINIDEIMDKMGKSINRVEVLIGTKIANIDKLCKQIQAEQNKNIESFKGSSK